MEKLFFIFNFGCLINILAGYPTEMGVNPPKDGNEYEIIRVEAVRFRDGHLMEPKNLSLNLNDIYRTNGKSGITEKRQKQGTNVAGPDTFGQAVASDGLDILTSTLTGDVGGGVSAFLSILTNPTTLVGFKGVQQGVVAGVKGVQAGVQEGVKRVQTGVQGLFDGVTSTIQNGLGLFGIAPTTTTTTAPPPTLPPIQLPPQIIEIHTAPSSGVQQGPQYAPVAGQQPPSASIASAPIPSANPGASNNFPAQVPVNSDPAQQIYFVLGQDQGSSQSQNFIPVQIPQENFNLNNLNQQQLLQQLVQQVQQQKVQPVAPPVPPVSQPPQNAGNQNNNSNKEILNSTGTPAAVDKDPNEEEDEDEDNNNNDV